MQSLNRISIANLYKTLIALNYRREKPPQFQLYCTVATVPSSIGSINGDNSNSKSNRNKPRENKKKETLESKIITLGKTSVDVASLIDQWVKDGNKVHFTVLRLIINELYKRSRFSQALQVSKWMKDNEASTFSPVEHALHIDLIGKVHGYRYAESYFNNLSLANKTEKTNEALLHCYVRQRDTAKVLSHLKTMKEKGLKLSTVVYNDIMSLYTRTGKYEKVPDVLSQMKESGVSPDNMTYKICLNSYCQRSDIKGMEMLLDEMECQKPHIFVDRRTRALIVNLYNKEGLSAKANDFLKRANERLPVGDANGNKPRETNMIHKETLYSKIIPLGNPSINIASLIDQWVKDGNKVRFVELHCIVVDLRKRTRSSQALQVSEWMKNYEAFTFSPSHHATHIDLIGKVHGRLSAETYFNKLSEADKTEKTYGALLHCFVRERDTFKAFSHLQSMKEKGLKLSSVVCNDLMSLFTHIGEYEKVPDVLSQMKENGVSPDNISYNICLNSYGQRSDIKGMEMLLDEMERQPDVSIDWSTCALVANLYIKAGLSSKANDYLKRAEERLPVEDANDGYNHLISLHATQGNKSEVYRLWRLEKITCKMRVNRDYINMLSNLMRMNEFEEAEKVLEEWETSGNQYVIRIPYLVIDKYIKKGHCVKAEKILKDLMQKGKLPNADRWCRIAIRYLELGDTTRAKECMKMAHSIGIEDEWKPEFSLMTILFAVIGVEEESIDTLEDTRTSEKETNTSSIDTLVDTRTSEKETNTSSIDTLVDTRTPEKETNTSSFVTFVDIILQKKRR